MLGKAPSESYSDDDNASVSIRNQKRPQVPPFSTARTPLAAASSHSDDEEEDITGSPSQSSSGFVVKKMKLTSQAAQFYTTLVVKCCNHTKEWGGFVSTTLRSIQLFKKVEVALRDRVAFPLPDGVALKDLMKESFFTGDDADAQYKIHCIDETAPLTRAMTDKANRIWENKYSSTKTELANKVLPKFLIILNELTGRDRNKSG